MTRDVKGSGLLCGRGRGVNMGGVGEWGWVSKRERRGEGDKEEERDRQREGENTYACMISGPKPSMHQSYKLVPCFP